MAIVICICKLVLFFYLFYSLYCLNFGKEYKILKVLYVVACVEEIYKIMNSHFNFMYDVPTKCNFFLVILLLCTISEIVEKRKVWYLVYLFILGYNVYYNYFFAPNIRLYMLEVITVIEVTKYITNIISIILIKNVINKNRS